MGKPLELAPVSAILGRRQTRFRRAIAAANPDVSRTRAYCCERLLATKAFHGNRFTMSRV